MAALLLAVKTWFAQIAGMYCESPTVLFPCFHLGGFGNVVKANSSPSVLKTKRPSFKRPSRCISNPVAVCFGSASWEAESFLLSHRTWLEPKRLFVGGGVLLEQTPSLRQEHFQNILSCQHRRCGDLHISQHWRFQVTFLDVDSMSKSSNHCLSEIRTT